MINCSTSIGVIPDSKNPPKVQVFDDAAVNIYWWLDVLVLDAQGAEIDRFIGFGGEEKSDETFQMIKRHLLEYRDNLAVREINRLLLSNASVYVKEKARLMKTFIQEPDFSTVKDSFPYLEVRADPGLFADCYVVWRGKVANVQIGEDEITFDLLVGYEEETELLGLVPVSLDFASKIENGDGIEVLGKVQVQEQQIYLQGISLHRLYRRG